MESPGTKTPGLATVVGLTMAAACGGGDTSFDPGMVGDSLPAWGSVFSEEAFRVGQLGGAEHETFGEIGGAAFVGSDLVISDAQANRIHVFDGEGRHVRSMGGPGQGPGEFRRVGPIVSLPDGSIAALDAGSNRLQVFARDGSPLRTRSFPWSSESMCALGSTLVFLGRHPDTPAPIHLLDFASDEVVSIGSVPALDSESLHAPALAGRLLEGTVGCFGSTIVYARSSEGRVTALDRSGSGVWEAGIPGFVPIEFYIDEARGVGRRMPDGASEVNVFVGMVRVGDVLHTHVMRGIVSVGVIGISTVVLDPDTGTLLGVDHTTPQVLAVGDDRVAVLLASDYPLIAVYPLQPR